MVGYCKKIIAACIARIVAAACLTNPVVTPHLWCKQKPINYVMLNCVGFNKASVIIQTSSLLGE